MTALFDAEISGMSKRVGYLILTIFALVAAYLIYLNGWTVSLQAVVAAILALVIAVAVLAGELGFSVALTEMYHTLFPPAPLWVEPRAASSLRDRRLVEALTQRLELIERRGRIAFWQDRTTGQRWKSIANDFEFTEESLFEPITAREPVRFDR